MTHRIFTSWLGGELADQLLVYAIDAQGSFKPTKVRFSEGSENRVEERGRRSLFLRDLGPFAELLERKATGLQGELEKTFGMSHVPTTEIELEIVAHRDGDFYDSHIDTFAAPDAMTGANRRLSLVYYFHRLPRRFTGGSLRLLGLSDRMPTVTVDPTHDSLLAFPSFLPHAVEKVCSDSHDFADSRFAVNIWLSG